VFVLHTGTLFMARAQYALKQIEARMLLNATNSAQMCAITPRVLITRPGAVSLESMDMHNGSRWDTGTLPGALSSIYDAPDLRRAFLRAPVTTEA